jgi:hypothetical protein
MNNYQHLENRKQEILEALKGLDSYDTLAKSKVYLFNIYYRECEHIPRWIQAYSSELSKEHHLAKFIKSKLRCPGCLEKVEKYFKKYEQYTRTNT